MKKYAFHIGIDISKEKLDVVVLDVNNPAAASHFIVANSAKGVKQIITWLGRKKYDPGLALFCCEHTGVYTYPLSGCLSKLGLDLWIVPAIEIKRSKGVSRGKNDKSDARDIAFYSLRHLDKLTLSVETGKELQALKLLRGEREKLLKAVLIFKSSSESKEFLDKKTYGHIEKINLKTIKYLKARLEETEKQIREIIKGHRELKKQFDLLKSVPGVGEQTAIYTIIATKGFKSFSSWRKFACYSGVAPFEYSSGSSIRAQTRVSHMADKKMKSLLQMCVLSAVRHDPQIKIYYNRKKEEGKNTMLVMNNIRCKIISRMFAVIKRETPFLNIDKFAA